MRALTTPHCKAPLSGLFTPLDNELFVFELPHIPELRQELKTKQESDEQMDVWTDM